METKIIRIKPLAFKQSSKQTLNQTLFYIKILTELPSSDHNALVLQPSNLTLDDVISVNETFDWKMEEGNYCQILFLTSKSNPKVQDDIILHFDYLLNILKTQRNQKDHQVELFQNIVSNQGYQFEFTIQEVDLAISMISSSSISQKCKCRGKRSSNQSVRGHFMKKKQFNHPVYCAICHGFIWGLHYQGFQCIQCDLVTHKKCYQSIPFWCLKSSQPEPDYFKGCASLKVRIKHIFKQYDAPFVRALVTRHHSHCGHCGSQIFRNALKCAQCSLIIHEDCQSNVPAFCEISYNSIGTIISDDDLLRNVTRMHIPKPIRGINTNSTSSSLDLSWLDPLPESDLWRNGSIKLPTFKDFEYVGCLGDGAFSQVYCVQHISSKQFVAIKVVDGTNEEARQQLEVERQILFRYGQGNPYMIKVYCTFHQGSKLFLVMELIEGGTLYNKIQTTRMTEDDMRFYLAELISVLQYLHSNKIIYRDLKLEHAAVCSGGHIRLVDYGLGRLLKANDETCHTFCGTYSYMAPEVRCLEKDPSGKGYSYAVDFWALGIMFLQMLCGEQLDFPQMLANCNEENNGRKNFAEILELPRHIKCEARSCVIALLENNPEKRLGSPNSPHGPIRDHPFFKVGRQVDWQAIDEGLFKSTLKHSLATLIPSNSDMSVRQSLSTLMIDRGNHGKSDWMAAGETTSTPADDERFKSFDYISQSAWLELIQIDIF